MHVIETDDSEVVGAGVHLDDKAVGRDRDHLADRALAIVVAHASSSFCSCFFQLFF